MSPAPYCSTSWTTWGWWPTTSDAPPSMSACARSRCAGEALVSYSFPQWMSAAVGNGTLEISDGEISRGKLVADFAERIRPIALARHDAADGAREHDVASEHERCRTLGRRGSYGNAFRGGPCRRLVRGSANALARYAFHPCADDKRGGCGIKDDAEQQGSGKAGNHGNAVSPFRSRPLPASRAPRRHSPAASTRWRGAGIASHFRGGHRAGATRAGRTSGVRHSPARRPIGAPGRRYQCVRLLRPFSGDTSNGRVRCLLRQFGVPFPRRLRGRARP